MQGDLAVNPPGIRLPEPHRFLLLTAFFIDVQASTGERIRTGFAMLS